MARDASGHNRARRDDDVGLLRDCDASQFGEPPLIAVGVPVIDADVLAFLITEFAKSGLKPIPGRAVAAGCAKPQIDKVWHPAFRDS